jgi:hypothetical protein
VGTALRPSPSIPANDEGDVLVVEFTVDDATPQLLAYAVERLFEAGAQDVHTTAGPHEERTRGTPRHGLARPTPSKRSRDPPSPKRRRWVFATAAKRACELERSFERSPPRSVTFASRSAARRTRAACMAGVRRLRGRGSQAPRPAIGGTAAALGARRKKGSR